MLSRHLRNAGKFFTILTSMSTPWLSIPSGSSPSEGRRPSATLVTSRSVSAGGKYGSLISFVRRAILAPDACLHNRKCPGIFFAEASIFATVAQTLATYTLSKATDTNGNVIEPCVGTFGTNLWYVARCLVGPLRPLTSSVLVTHCRFSARQLCGPTRRKRFWTRFATMHKTLVKHHCSWKSDRCLPREPCVPLMQHNALN